MRISVILIAILLANGAYAGGAVHMMLRDAALFHDEQHIRTLIGKEVQAEQKGDLEAEDQAIVAISKTTNPSGRGSGLR
jgi:hypothetical protein